jgi:TolB protein
MKKLMLVLLLSVVGASARAERLKMEVGGANFRPYPVAVPEIQGPVTEVPASRLRRLELTRLLRDSLEMARTLTLVPPSTYLRREGMGGAPAFAAWEAVGASGLILADLQQEAAQSVLNLRFFEVGSQRQALQLQCKKSADPLRPCVQQFLDQIVGYLTGEPGIFSSRIAFVRRLGGQKQVFSCGLDGTELRQLTRLPTLNLLPTWDRTGEHVLFTSFASGNADLVQLRLVDGAISPLSRAAGLNTGAAVSPDGKQIALTLSKDGNTEIYVMDRDGGNLRRLTNSWGQDVSPSWSPDGKRIAFVSSRSGNPHLYVMNVDGSRVRRLTFAGTYNQEPDWSPRADGQIVFTARDEAMQFDLFLVHPETSLISRLTQDEGRNESPSHSPDGHHIVFVSTRGGAPRRALWVMDVDGAAPRMLHLEGGNDAEAPTWGPRLGYP